MIEEIPAQRQSEIEIYVRDCPPERLVMWLESVVGPLAQAEPAGKAVVYQSGVGPVVVTPQVEGGPFVGVWFNSCATPWATDVDCGRRAARDLRCVVRCSPGQQFPHVPWWAADKFLEIDGDVEQIVTWEDAESGAAHY
jgi:hypothetical protein